MNVAVTVIGVRELVGRFAALSDQASGDALATAAKAGAKITETRWKALFRSAAAPSVAGAPPRVRTGNYMRSIHTEIIEKSRSRAVAAVGPDDLDPNYPLYLEYGTSRMPAHPIARPAFEQTREDAEREMATVLGGLLRFQ